jgi:hypothetical protein
MADKGNTTTENTYEKINEMMIGCCKDAMHRVSTPEHAKNNILHRVSAKNRTNKEKRTIEFIL